MSGPRVFLDISFDNSPPERLVIQLFAEPPKAVENFRALCAGDMGIGKNTGKPLHYKGCGFYRAFNGIAIEGGDFENQDGTGGESIYGGTFPDENNHMGCSGRGIIMMANQGPGRIGSQFYICLRHYPPIDGFHVPVGKVIKGMDTLEKFDQLVLVSLKSFARVKIKDCGEISGDNVMVSDKPQSSSGFFFAAAATQNEELEATLKNDLLVTNGNDREVTSEKPSSSNPHQHSDDPSKSRNRSKKSESPISESNVEESDDWQKMKRSNSKADWPVIAASVVATVLVGAFFLQAK